MKYAIIAIVVAALLGYAGYFVYTMPVETPAIWGIKIDQRFFNHPLYHEDHFYFVSGDRKTSEFHLHAIDAKGNLVAVSDTLPFPLFQQIIVNNTLVASDHARMVRGFSLPSLDLLWEIASLEHFFAAPVQISPTEFLFQSASQVIYAIDAESGEPIWNQEFQDSVISYTLDEVLVCVHGYKELDNPNWRISGVDLKNGEILWTYEGSITHRRPALSEGVLITTTKTGTVIILDQHTGELLYNHADANKDEDEDEVEDEDKDKNKDEGEDEKLYLTGMEILTALGDVLLMLDSTGRNVIVMSLNTGKSWEVPTRKEIVNAVRTDNVLMIAEKAGIRGYNVETGEQLWKSDLEDVYNVFAFRDGVFATYKDSFYARQTYGAYIDTLTGEKVWLAFDDSIFRKPINTEQGDFLLSYGGRIRMMPHDGRPPKPEVKPEELEEESEDEPEETKEEEPKKRLWQISKK